MENYRDNINTILLVAILVATVTYVADFTMPGGYNNSDPTQGMAILNERKFQIFLICDTIALYSSMIVAVSVIRVQLCDLNLILTSVRLALPLLRLALSMISLAFMAGVYVVASKLTWLANVVLIMGIVSLSILLALLYPLFFPDATALPVIWHIPCYFFCLMMLASGSYYFFWLMFAILSVSGRNLYKSFHAVLLYIILGVLNYFAGCFSSWLYYCTM